ncbi:MAG TPA: riboflavin synthase [Candidatus Krumholzibacteria bacterium]|nr:riboflavin synthase [Candidatus Krumholzibacteria bacterium]
MFTGIVETVGEIARAEEGPELRRLRIKAPSIASTLSIGDSVAVDGVCLTVESCDAAAFAAIAVAETLARTTLGERCAGDRVNIERAATIERFLGGHLVQGHVDATARVLSFDPSAPSPLLVVEVPDSVHALCVEKGSIAIDGVSLTIARKTAAGRIEIAIVPHTITHTTIGSYRAGRRVNVEADVIAKYVREFVQRGSTS